MSKVGAQRDLGNAGRSLLHKWRRPLNTAGSQGAGTENTEKEEIKKKGKWWEFKSGKQLLLDIGKALRSKIVRLGAEERVFPETGADVRKGNGWNRNKWGGKGGFLQAHFSSSFCAKSLLHFP